MRRGQVPFNRHAVGGHFNTRRGLPTFSLNESLGAIKHDGGVTASMQRKRVRNFPMIQCIATAFSIGRQLRAPLQDQ